MKVFIVDDELLVRIGIKSCIEWTKHGIEVIGEASDGEEALQQIRRLKPDVILLDIKMPKMDGIELMNHLKNEKLECKVIILSGFDDLYHVREAMKLGASDYLHKPCMNGKDVLDSLLSIRKQLETEKASSYQFNQSNNNEKSKLVLKKAFLSEMLEGRYGSDQDFIQKSRELDIKLENGYFSCLAFSVKNLCEIRKRYEGQDISLLQSSIENIMDGIFAREKGVEFFCHDKNTYVIIIGIKGIISERRIIENTDSLVKLVLDATKRFLNIDITIGVSDIHMTFREVKRAFDEADMSLRQKFYSNTGNIIYYRDIRRKVDSSTFSKIDSAIAKLKDHLTKYEYDKFNIALKELVDLLEEDQCLSEEDVKKLFNAFLFLVKGGKEYLEEMELLVSCETLRQLYYVWGDIVGSKLSNDQYLKQHQTNNYIVKGIVRYIDENYQTEISLNLLAQKFNISPNYISRLFKEVTGETLFNYLNGVRIEKAKEFLKDMQMKMYEIGYKVGFKSAVHFNIVFNKITGLTPKQYRDSL